MSVLIDFNPSSAASARAIPASGLTRSQRLLIGLGRVLASLARRRHIHALSALDDRMLADIGLTRADVRAATRWSLWSDPADRLTSAADERRAARERSQARFG